MLNVRPVGRAFRVTSQPPVNTRIGRSAADRLPGEVVGLEVPGARDSGRTRPRGVGLRPAGQPGRHLPLRRAVYSRTAPPSPFSSTRPISVNDSDTELAASTTAWLTSTSWGRAWSAIRGREVDRPAVVVTLWNRTGPAWSPTCAGGRPAHARPSMISSAATTPEPCSGY